MNDDPVLLKKIAAWRKAGASDEDLDDLIAEYEQQHRFADPTVPATSLGGEQILPGAPRKQSVGEKVAGAIGAGAQGLTGGFSDELGGVVGAVGSAVTGQNPAKGYKRTRDAARKQIKAFEETNPVLSAVTEVGGGLATLPFAGIKAAKGIPTVAKGIRQAVGLGAKAGGVYGLGKGEGSLEDQALNTALGTFLGGATGLVPTAAVKGAQALKGVVKTATTAPWEVAKVAGRLAMGQPPRFSSLLKLLGKQSDDVLPSPPRTSVGEDVMDLLGPNSLGTPGKVVGSIPPSPAPEALKEMLTQPKADPFRDPIWGRRRGVGPKDPRPLRPKVNKPGTPDNELMAALQASVKQGAPEGASEKDLRTLAEYLMANQDENLETLLQLSLKRRP